MRWKKDEQSVEIKIGTSTHHSEKVWFVEFTPPISPYPTVESRRVIPDSEKEGIAKLKQDVSTWAERQGYVIDTVISD